jgi:DNA/RNA-binding domain of Phe-tRNA-synthetase-like protein
MRFTIQPDVFPRFPGLSIAVAVASGLDNAASYPGVSATWRAAWAEAQAAAARYGNAQSHPRVRPWRERFTAMGVSGKQFPSSIEAMLRRALKGGEPFTINPLVDFYNTVSLRHTVPAGAFDLGDVAGSLELRLTRPGDTFTALDAAEADTVPSGEVAYAAGNVILTRHFVWRQARAALVTPATRAVFLVSEILGEVGRPVAEAVLNEFQSGLREHFGLTSAGFLLDERHASIEW